MSVQWTPCFQHATGGAGNREMSFLTLVIPRSHHQGHTISNKRRTSFSDSPLYLDVRVEEDTLKNVVPHSVATAFASIVLPVPGGPTISTPWKAKTKVMNNKQRNFAIGTLCYISVDPRSVFKLFNNIIVISGKQKTRILLLRTAWKCSPISSYHSTGVRITKASNCCCTYHLGSGQ